MAGKKRKKWKIRSPLTGRYWSRQDLQQFFHLSNSQYEYMTRVLFLKLGINRKRPWMTQERLTELIVRRCRSTDPWRNYEPDDLEITLGCLFSRLAAAYSRRSDPAEEVLTVMTCPDPIFEWDANCADRQYHGSYTD